MKAPNISSPRALHWYLILLGLLLAAVVVTLLSKPAAQTQADPSVTETHIEAPAAK